MTRLRLELVLLVFMLSSMGLVVMAAYTADEDSMQTTEHEGLGEVSMVIPEMNERIEGHVDTMDDALADAGYGDERDEG